MNDAPAPAALIVRGLRVARGAREVLRGVDLHVARGELCALMGASGAGKSTVLRAVAALEPFGAGEIDVDGFTLRPGPRRPESRLRALRQRVGMVFQAHALFEHLTAEANVTLAPVHVLGRAPACARDAARALLADLGVAARAHAYPRELSGGEAQRVAIARALALDPGLLLMDEPTAALDPARRAALGTLLRGLAGQGRALLVSTHDVEFARAYADRVVVLAEGTLVEQGPTAAVLERPTHAAVRALLHAPAPSETEARRD